MTSFGVPNAKTGTKFYYGKMGETVVNQEAPKQTTVYIVDVCNKSIQLRRALSDTSQIFWKRATKREWKIKGAKEAGFADVRSHPVQQRQYL